MKKILIKIVCGAIALCMVVTGLIACSTPGWKSGNLKNGGEIISDGGFVAESENYIYFLNGVADSNEDNAFGQPVKGTLMAIDKTDLSSQAEIVVPKLFAATDYNAGLFIREDYVYYGTPSVEKNSSGEVAKTEMTFMRTKLDGSAQTDEFFTVSALSNEYRFVENDGVVYIVYYDSVDMELVSYNTNTKTEMIIAKTDDKADALSLDTYKIVGEQGKEDAVIIFTVKVYTEAYEENKGVGYTRPTADYNQVYAYAAGDIVNENGVAGTLVLDGAPATESDEAKTFALSLVKDQYVYYTETINSKTETYAKTIAQLVAKEEPASIVNTAYAVDANLIVALDEVYILDAGTVYLTTMTEKDNLIKKRVAVCSTINQLLFVEDANADGINDTLYYYNSSNAIAKIELKNIVDGDLDKEVNEIRLSEGSASTTWYRPEIVKINGVSYLFYLDNSSLGASYVKYFDLDVDYNDDVVKEDTDEDDKDDLFYLNIEKIGAIGQITKKDQASIISAKISALSEELDGGVLEMEEDAEGKLFNAKVNEMKDLYDEIDDKEIKDAISTSAIDTLNDYIKAVEIANLYNQLAGIQNCADKDQAQAYEAIYQSIKSEVVEFKASADRDRIDGYISNNIKSYYSKAVKLFEAEEK